MRGFGDRRPISRKLEILYFQFILEQVNQNFLPCIKISNSKLNRKSKFLRHPTFSSKISTLISINYIFYQLAPNHLLKSNKSKPFVNTFIEGITFNISKTHKFDVNCYRPICMYIITINPIICSLFWKLIIINQCLIL